MTPDQAKAALGQDAPLATLGIGDWSVALQRRIKKCRSELEDAEAEAARRRDALEASNAEWTAFRADPEAYVRAKGREAA